MQAYEGYFENGQFYISEQTTHIKGRRRAFITILDEPPQTYGEQILDIIKSKNIPNIKLEADENGNAYIDKELHTELYDWAVNDYTEWRESLWEDLTLDEVFERAKKAQEKHGVPEGVQII